MSHVPTDFPYDFSHLEMKYAEIQGDSSREIAVQSASTVMTYVNPPFILEDSGLFINSLGGFPGPYSSYIFGTLGWEGILKLVGDSRVAKFYSVIVYVDDDRDIHVFVGEVMGKISGEGRGDGGFGFDPIFVPEGHEQTFAEMGEEKNQISHRSRSVLSFLSYLEKKV